LWRQIEIGKDFVPSLDEIRPAQIVRVLRVKLNSNFVDGVETIKVAKDCFAEARILPARVLPE
jgi:hypothetical protein